METLGSRKLIETSGNKVTRQEVSWLWPGRIPTGTLTLLIGDPGAGKSYLTHDTAARVTTGQTWPDGHGKAPLGDVILVNAEDDPETTLKPRLDVLGADDSRYHVITGISDLGTAQLFNLQLDLPALEASIIEHKAKLVIIDPLGMYLGKLDAWKMEQVYPVLAKLRDLARKHQVAIVGVLHLNKASDKSAIYRAMGSMAFQAAPRAVFLVSKDKKDPGRRLLAPVKFNIGREPSTLAFRIVDPGNGIGQLDWEGSTDTTADEALSGVTQDGDQSELEEAEAFLTDLLADGPVPYQEVQKKAREAGVAPRTLRRAKDKLAVGVFKEPVRNGRWMWKKLDLRDGRAA